jgi:HEAT repeat protein
MPKKWIVLLDVDETCAMSNSLYGQHDGGYRYHEPLFQALKKADLVQAYLFTSYSLRGIAKNLSEEPIAAPSRLKLVQHLTQLGFQVQGVLTIFDPSFNQGIGAYYEQRIKPFESQVLQGIDLNGKTAAEPYILACQQEDKLRKEADESRADKGSLYAYLVQQLEKTLLQNNFAFIVVDDRTVHLEAVQNQNAHHRYPLCPLRAKPHSTIEEYLNPLLQFSHQLRNEEIKMKFEQTVSRFNKDGQYEALHKKFQSQLREPTPKIDAELFQEIDRFFIQGQISQERAETVMPLRSPPWPEPDIHAEQLRQAILALIANAPTGSIEPQVRLYGLQDESSPSLIPLSLARRLLSQNEQGQVVKKNTTGNNVVTRLGQVFFKSSSGAELYPLVEQAVYQMSRQFGGELVTPTRLLFLEMSEEMIPLQASLAVEGVSLEDIISLPGILNGFKTLLGIETLPKLFPAFLRLMDDSDPSYSDWLHRHHYPSDMSWEDQCKILLDSLYALPAERRPFGVSREQGESKIGSERRIIEDTLRKDFQGESLFPLMALIEACPKLTEEIHLADLLNLPNFFRVCGRLYPRFPSEPEKYLKEAEQILSHFDPDNLHRHLLLALLTEPGDHKGDNFKVPLNFDLKGNLLPLKIIAIDNDMALDGCFKGKGEHTLAIKTIIYRLISLSSTPLSPSLVNSLSSNPPEVLLLRWLANLVHYSQRYADLQKAQIVSSGLFTALHLQAPFSVATVARLSRRLQSIQNLLKSTPASTAEGLLLTIEPLVGSYYQLFGQRYPDLQTFVIQLFNHSSAPTLEALLSDHLQDHLGGKTLEQHLKEAPLLKALSPRGPYSYQEDINTLILSVFQGNSSVRQNSPFLYLCSLFKRLGYTNLRFPTLSLSEATLAEVYSQEPEGLILLLKACETVTLQFESVTVALQDPLILFHSLASQSRFKSLVLKMLIHYDISLKTHRPIDGLTPLHFAVSFSPDSVLLLLEAGAEMESFDHQKLTPLDYAVSYQQTQAIKTLLCFGAGERLSIANGFKLISHYRAPYPELCQALVSRHRDLAWQLALEQISQERETPERVCLIGPHHKRYLKSDIYRQIFGNHSYFPKENVYGRHNVTSINCRLDNISVGLHLKENPELPGREIMVQTLASQLFGFITPHVALWRFSKTSGFIRTIEVGYPVLASHTITGKLLTEVFERHPEWLAKLDPQSVCEAIILAMLINPEDGRADNYIVQPFSKGTDTSYRLISIDNDHAFVRPVSLRSNGQEIEGPKGLQVKTILYCLDFMKDPLVDCLRERLITLDILQVLSAWLQSLQKKQQEIERLFNAQERRALKAQQLYLDISFKPSIVADIYQKLVRMQAVLRKHPDASLSRLLRYVIPSLSIRYETAFKHSDLPQDRFMFLTKGQFKVIRVAGKEALSSKTPARDIINQTAELSLEELKITQEEEASPQKALECLEKLVKEFTQLRAIRDEVQGGNFKQFITLMNSDHQERIVNGQGAELPSLDFSAMKLSNGNPDIKLQERVLEVLKRVSFRHLKIHHCAALTDPWLRSLLMPSGGLISLDIQNCVQLTHQAIRDLAVHCRFLEKLGLRELPKLQRVIELPFIKLRVLQIADCQNLSEWRITAPQLKRIEINRCERLTRFGVQSLVLTHLKLTYCNQFSKEQLNKSVLLPENLRFIDLSGCSLITHMKVYEKYPQLAQLPLHELSNETVREFDQQLEKTLSELSFKHPLRFLTIESLQQKASQLIARQHQVVTTLLRSLSDRDSSVRGRAAEVLGMLSATFNSTHQTEVVGALLRSLSNGSSFVRDRAAEALGRVFDTLSTVSQTEVASALLKGLSDSDSSVRATVAQALIKPFVNLNSANQVEVVNGLLKSLNSRSSFTRVHVVEALVKLFASITPANQLEVISVLLKCLSDNDSSVRQHAVEALGKLFAALNPTSRAEVISGLLKCLSDSDYFVSVRAAKILETLVVPGPADQLEAVSRMLKCLSNAEPSVRVRGAQTLGELSAALTPINQAEVISTLLRRLSDSDPSVRQHAAKAVGKLSVGLSPSSQTEVASTLLKCLSDSESIVRARVAEALGRLSANLNPRQQAEVISALLKGLSDSSFDIRALGIKALGGLSAVLTLINQEEVISTLLKCLSDSEPRARAHVAEALGRLSANLNPRHQTEVIGALLKCLSDSEPSVRSCVVLTLVKFFVTLSPTNQTEVVSGLLKCLSDSEFSIKVNVILALATLSDTFSSTSRLAVVSGLLKSLGDSDYTIKASVTPALIKLFATLSPVNQTEVVSGLLKGLSDNEPSVRVRAAEALAKFPNIPTSQLEEVVSGLLKRLSDSEPSVRAYVALAVGNLCVTLDPPIQLEVVNTWLKCLSNWDLTIKEDAEKVIANLFSPKYIVDNLMHTFKATYQKEFFPKNSNSRMEGFEDKERKEKRETITRIKGLFENTCEVDVPADGTCLFYSVMFAFLLPVVQDSVKFRARYLKLFGEEVSGSAEENRKRLQEYDGDPEFISRHTVAFEVLVNTIFRQKIVKYMREHAGDVRGYINTDITSFETQMKEMEDPTRRAWGGQPEIVAISRLLEVNVQIYKNQAGIAVLVPGGNRDPGYESNCQINLVYTSVHKNSGSKSHYHYLMEEEFLKKRLKSESKVSSEESSSLSSPPSLSPSPSVSFPQSTVPLFRGVRGAVEATSLRSMSFGNAGEGKGMAEIKTMVEQAVSPEEADVSSFVIGMPEKVTTVQSTSFLPAASSTLLTFNPKSRLPLLEQMGGPTPEFRTTVSSVEIKAVGALLEIELKNNKDIEESRELLALNLGAIALNRTPEATDTWELILSSQTAVENVLTTITRVTQPHAALSVSSTTKPPC